MATYGSSTVRSTKFIKADQSVLSLDSLAKAGDVYVSSANNDVIISAYKTSSPMTVVIPKKNVDSVKLKSATDDEKNLYKVTITLNSTYNSGAPVVGEDYKVNIVIYNLGGVWNPNGLSKTAMVRATSTDTFATLTAKLVTALQGVWDERFFTFTAVGSVITVTEVEQPWIRGVHQFDTLDFTVSALEDSTGEEWATVGDKTVSEKLVNGKAVADMEWFYQGEIGDRYSYPGIPKVSVPVEYQVDPTKGYSILTVTYHYAGNAEDNGRSPQVLLIASETDAVLSSIQSELEA